MSTNKRTVSDSDTNNPAAESKNSTQTAEAAVTTAPEKEITATALNVTEKTSEKAQYEGVTNFVYIGPSLPSGQLKSNTVLNGTYKQITEYYKDTIELYPSIAKLIVPVTRLAEARGKTQTSGNIMYNYYQEIAAGAKGDKQ